MFAVPVALVVPVMMAMMMRMMVVFLNTFPSSWSSVATPWTIAIAAIGYCAAVTSFNDAHSDGSFDGCNR